MICDGRELEHAVAVGGGSGLPATIAALFHLGLDTNAVVAMTDNGGSTGKLRENMGAVPPGDIRNCLVAMAKDKDIPLAKALQYRFPVFADEDRGHTLGNLMLTALSEVTGSFPESVAIVGKLIDAQGHVYPSTVDSIQLKGIDRAGNTREGQMELSSSSPAIERAWIEPEASGYSEALAALREADLIVLGPGSLYTSVIPNLLVGGTIDAIRESGACVISVCNVSNQQGETRNLSAADHVQALLDHGLKGLLDAVIIHDHEQALGPSVVEPIVVDDEEQAEIEAKGVAVIKADVVNQNFPSWHDRIKLSEAFKEAVKVCHSQQK